MLVLTTKRIKVITICLMERMTSAPTPRQQTQSTMVSNQQLALPTDAHWALPGYETDITQIISDLRGAVWRLEGWWGGASAYSR